MANLALHPQTQKNIDAFLAQPSHALLIVGPAGGGKQAIAKHIAAALLGLSNGELDSYPYFYTVQSSGGKAIGIESIRELEHQLQLRVPSTAPVTRLVLLRDSHLLTTEAQNAFLKTLEEPPLGTVLLLTATSADQLLPTIRSRAQQLLVIRPEKQLLLETIASGLTPVERERLYNMSGGLPGLLHALMLDGDHPLVIGATTARQLLTGSSFERLLLVDTLSKDKQQTADTLFMLIQMAHLQLQHIPDEASERWKRIMKATYNAQSAILSSGQPKLVLTELMLGLG